MRNFVRSLLGLLTAFAIFLMSAAVLAANETPRDFKVATEMSYLGSDQGVPCQVSMINITENFEFTKIATDHLHPWINDGAVSSPVMYAEIIKESYGFKMSVRVTKVANRYSPMCNISITTANQRFADLHHNFG